MAKPTLRHFPFWMLLLIAFVFTDTASAARILVTTGQDGLGNIPGCSLREAVRAINLQTNSNGCNNGSPQPYGTNDRILFAEGVNNILLNFPANPTVNTAIFISRRVSIRGNGNNTTRIIGGNTNLILIENLSSLQLRSIQLRNAGTALRNAPDTTAELIDVRITRQSRRAVINQGIMTMDRVSVFANSGGGIFNGNAIPVGLIGADGPVSAVPDCEPTCLDPGGDTSTSPTAFPPGDAPAGLSITRSVIDANGPTACAGIANGGGLVQGPGGNSLTQEKIVGALTITRSRVVRNRAGNNNGGGICNASTALISQSEISGNRAQRGAGIMVGVPLLMPGMTRAFTVVANTTISLNRAGIAGGGIFIEPAGGVLTIQYSTIAFNVADGTGANDAGGLVSNVGFTTTFRLNALVGNRSGAAGVAIQDCANITLQGELNFWPVNNTGTCQLAGQQNITTGNALLGELGGNGTTDSFSHLPAPNSVLVDVIPSTNVRCSGFDQRQFVRPRNGNINPGIGCDIGAVERP